MALIPITNDKNTPRKVAGRTIMPGATAYFDEHSLPPHLRPGHKVEVESEPDNPLLLILEDSIKVVTAVLPSLSDEQLNELEVLELAGANRAGLAKAIQEDRLRRADLSLDDDPDSVVTGDDLVTQPGQTGVSKYIEEHGVDVAK